MMTIIMMTMMMTTTTTSIMISSLFFVHVPVMMRASPVELSWVPRLWLLQNLLHLIIFPVALRRAFQSSSLSWYKKTEFFSSLSSPYRYTVNNYFHIVNQHGIVFNLGQVVWKPVNTNPGSKVNQSMQINISYIKMFMFG